MSMVFKSKPAVGRSKPVEAKSKPLVARSKPVVVGQSVISPSECLQATGMKPTTGPSPILQSDHHPPE